MERGCESCKLVPGTDDGNNFSLHTEIDSLKAIYGDAATEERLSEHTLIVHVTLSDSASVHLTLNERGYPETEPSIRIDSTALPKSQIDLVIRKVLDREYVDLFNWISLIESELVALGEEERETGEIEIDCCDSKRVAQLFRFHHIYSSKKRKSMLAWGKEFSLTTLVIVIGKPGFLFLLGSEQSVKQVVRNTRAMGWQSMALHSEMIVEESQIEESISAIKEVLLDEMVVIMRRAKLDEMVAGMFT